MFVIHQVRQPKLDVHCFQVVGTVAMPMMTLGLLATVVTAASQIPARGRQWFVKNFARRETIYLLSNSIRVAAQMLCIYLIELFVWVCRPIMTSFIFFFGTNFPVLVPKPGIPPPGPTIHRLPLYYVIVSNFCTGFVSVESDSSNCAEACNFVDELFTDSASIGTVTFPVSIMAPGLPLRRSSCMADFACTNIGWNTRWYISAASRSCEFIGGILHWGHHNWSSSCDSDLPVGIVELKPQLWRHDMLLGWLVRSFLTFQGPLQP